MEKLLNYINSLTANDQKRFALACKTSIGYLKKACYINQKLGAGLSARIEQNSAGNVTRKDLHSDWKQIWPELK
jgi:DNA-binding transcriptional regulator YdaS (Cro superfamily)